MKKAEILAGRIYSDGKSGVRQVLAEGSAYKYNPSCEDEDCLRYRCLHSSVGMEIGLESNMTRTAFAAWAKREIPAAEVTAFLRGLQATKIVKKLSQTQLAFLRDFDSDLTETTLVECHRDELRAAKACRDKGLIRDMPDKLGKYDRAFDVTFSALGLEVLARILNAESSVTS